MLSTGCQYNGTQQVNTFTDSNTASNPFSSSLLISPKLSREARSQAKEAPRTMCGSHETVTSHNSRTPDVVTLRGSQVLLMKASHSFRPPNQHWTNRHIWFRHSATCWTDPSPREGRNQPTSQSETFEYYPFIYIYICLVGPDIYRSGVGKIYIYIQIDIQTDMCTSGNIGPRKGACLHTRACKISEWVAW